jgi:hypothetical protein
MNLKRFAETNGMTNEALADWLAGEIGVSRDGARKWVYGTRTPRLPVLQRISAATNGAVTANDFIPAPASHEANQ